MARRREQFPNLPLTESNVRVALSGEPIMRDIGAVEVNGGSVVLLENYPNSHGDFIANAVAIDLLASARVLFQTIQVEHLDVGIRAPALDRYGNTRYVPAVRAGLDRQTAVRLNYDNLIGSDYPIVFTRVGRYWFDGWTWQRLKQSNGLLQSSGE